jgi:hypothetical protein
MSSRVCVITPGPKRCEIPRSEYWDPAKISHGPPLFTDIFKIPKGIDRERTRAANFVGDSPAEQESAGNSPHPSNCLFVLFVF